MKIKYVVPRIITVSPQFLGCDPRAQRALRNDVAAAMSPGNGSVSSASGMTAALAISWCEERGEPYTVIAHPGMGYCVRRGTS